MPTPTLRLFLGMFGLALAGCASTAESPRGSSPASRASTPGSISLERTVGNRSVYLVTLFENGEVVFEGLAPGGESRRSVTKSVPLAQAAAVFAQLDVVELWTRSSRYDVETIQRGNDTVIVGSASFEVPWDILRAQYHGRSKRIDGLFYAPHELRDLKALIEKTVGLAEWVLPDPPPKK